MRVTLFRDHPAEGWPSMDRYAGAIRDALVTIAPTGWDIQTPMPPPPPWPSTYAQIVNRLTRYPVWARTRCGDVNHILDHSYAHLLYALDPDRTLITVHDVAPLRFPDHGRGLSRLSWFVAWRSLRRARHVITVSNFTATELQRFLRNSKRQIHIVPNAVASTFRRPSPSVVAAMRNEYAAPGQHLLLHVGHLQSRKNLAVVIEALRQLRLERFDVVLLQAGGVPDRSLQQLIEAYELQAYVRFLGKVSEAQLVVLYSVADVFVFPSLYEGFGMPILEAMACETPVVASNTASLPEVVGDAGLLVDPRNAEAWAHAIALVFSDSAAAGRLRAAARNHAGQFCWQHAAAKLLELYASVGRTNAFLAGAML